ncbi:hypothetical protein BU26DRAFT_333070 [Trematosphaeria pertusa]|uniref:Uncharacterized protein n=1 Tax=Trematosphaeria pertusa TaxID=390896 RepID=A0A6A6IER0_9PLEO|nr:uncharacterized protein BU26DRAFT_333070 [Trematosphaeria pertusa]KAF2248392.1 hypothetical protein BU26DRAFT_333070 [Trematosphaeria pertusa]
MGPPSVQPCHALPLGVCASRAACSRPEGGELPQVRIGSTLSVASLYPRRSSHSTLTCTAKPMALSGSYPKNLGTMAMIREWVGRGVFIICIVLVGLLSETLGSRQLRCKNTSAKRGSERQVVSRRMVQDDGVLAGLQALMVAIRSELRSGHNQRCPHVSAYLQGEHSVTQPGI